MKLFPAAAALMLTLLAACVSTPQGPAEASFYVMRHLEKAPGPDPALSEEGQANAACLAAWFGDDPPSAIYVSTTRRARETAAPLAKRLGISPAEYDPVDTPAFIARVSAEKGTILIVGHSNTVPDIVAGLGGTRPPPLTEADYGDIWRISRTSGRTEKLDLQRR